MSEAAPGFEQAVDALRAAFADAIWPHPPSGFTPVSPVRPMRQVLRGEIDGPDGSCAVAVKWFRPVTSADRVAKAVRGGKARRERRGLDALAAARVPCPDVVGSTSDGADLLITRWCDGLEPLPAPDDADAAQVRGLARLVARMHEAGVTHRDLTGKNLALRDGEPIVIDAGGVKQHSTLGRRDRATALARIANGWLMGVRRSVRLRALRTYMAAWGEARVRAMDRLVRRRAKVLRRKFLAGRDRRPTRAGRHFTLFTRDGVARGIRAALITGEGLEDQAAAWLREDPAGATSLKRGDRVLAFPLNGADQMAVLKRFDAAASGRLPRALRAFRRAEALRYRHIAVPRPLLAAIDPEGAGILVSAHVAGENLHTFVNDGAYAALDRDARVRLLQRLGRYIRMLHDAEVSHRDLKAPNLLVEPGLDVRVADLEGARIRRRPISWRRRARDLARLDASLAVSQADRLRVLRAYLAVPPWPRVDIRRLLEVIADRVAWKRGPSGLPR